MDWINLSQDINLLQATFKPGYLTTISVSRLCVVDDMMINEYGAVGGMRT
jgi:hypothetical protein